MAFRLSLRKLNSLTPDTHTNTDINTGMIHHTHTGNRRLLASTIVVTMLCCYLIVDAVLPLYGLWFHTASLGLWSTLPSRLLFPGWQLTPTLFGSSNGTAPPFALSWVTTGLFLLTTILVFLCYLLALRLLPRSVGVRFVMLSTTLLGLILLLAPTVTSQDIYSYIIYARMQVLYHLNPLITSPMTIIHDPTYAHLYWTNQPSAYGPTWIVLTSLLQWATTPFGTTSLTPMMLSLRALGLLAHLGSTFLLWSLCGKLQHLYGYKNERQRVLAVLAFAWNPLLLFEASVNGHNDVVMLFLVLLALWCLLRFAHQSYGYILAALIFALATCLKVNVVLLFPGLLLFVWWQARPVQARIHDIALMLAVYIVVIAVLYAPFWSHGSILLILRVNPGTSRAINSLPEFFSHLYNSLVTHSTQESGFSAEVILRYVSEVLFAVAYLGLCWYGLRVRHSSTEIHHRHTIESTIRWMMVAWLLYCFLGSPWFWPWYLVTFYGLFALLEALPTANEFLQLKFVLSVVQRFIVDVRPKNSSTINRWTTDRAKSVSVSVVLAVRLLAFCMLSLYCFYTWSPYGSFVPLLFHFRWVYLRGLWAWLPFLLLLFLVVSKYGKRLQTKKYHILSRDIADT